MKSFGDFGIDLRGRTGTEIKTTCPKCSQERKKKAYPCLNVNTEKGVWHCWHCDWSGTLAGGVWQAPKIQKVYSKPAIKDGIARVWHDWLVSRGITPETIKRNKLANTTVYMPQVEREVDAVGFPYWMSGELFNVKYRDMEKNFRLHAGAQRILYGHDDIEEGKPLVIVEGEIDKLSCEVAGFKNCVSVPDGAPAVGTKNYESKFDFLDASKEKLDKCSAFIIAVDNDAPGRKLQEELVRRLGPEKCLIVSWPEGHKDANDVLKMCGAEQLALSLLEAKPSPVKGIFYVNDIADSIDGLYQDGTIRGRETGWEAVNQYYTVREGEWTVVTGIPGHGKSEWLDALLVNIAKTYDWRFALCSPENQPLQNHFAKIAEKAVGMPFHRGYNGRMTPEDLTCAKEWINDKFAFILPEEPSLDSVLALAKIEIFRRGIKGLVIDPWNELDHSRQGTLSETEYISQSLSKLRRFARTHQIHVWIVAHPTKLIKDKNNKYPIPTPYDISGSAHWRNKADNAITVWRDQSVETQDVQIHVQKIRFKQVGKIGKALLKYDRATGRYFDAEPSRGGSEQWGE